MARTSSFKPTKRVTKTISFLDFSRKQLVESWCNVLVENNFFFSDKIYIKKFQKPFFLGGTQGNNLTEIQVFHKPTSHIAYL